MMLIWYPQRSQWKPLLFEFPLCGSWSSYVLKKMCKFLNIDASLLKIFAAYPYTEFCEHVEDVFPYKRNLSTPCLMVGQCTTEGCISPSIWKLLRLVFGSCSCLATPKVLLRPHRNQFGIGIQKISASSKALYAIYLSTMYPRLLFKMT